MKQITVFILFFAALCNLAAADGVTVGIRLVEQKIYFLNDDIQVKVTVKNETVDTRQFRIADNRAFSLDFDVRTAINRPEERHSESFQNARNSLKPVFYRDISLAPGEEYSLVVNFNDFITLRDPGLYVVQVLLFPDLYMSETSPSAASNKLTLNIRPAAENDVQRAEIEAQIDKAALRDDLPPDKVIEYTLKARQIDQWSKFFLYIDLTSLYNNNFLTSPQSRDQFNRLSEAEKKTRIDAYRNQMTSAKAEWNLVLRSSEFKILETKYSASEATVVVDQVYQHPDYKEPRRYIYTLRRPAGTWEITKYQVTNQGTGVR